MKMWVLKLLNHAKLLITYCLTNNRQVSSGHLVCHKQNKLMVIIFIILYYPCVEIPSWQPHQRAPNMLVRKTGVLHPEKPCPTRESNPGPSCWDTSMLTVLPYFDQLMFRSDGNVVMDQVGYSWTAVWLQPILTVFKKF